MDLMKLLEAQGNPSNSKALGEHKVSTVVTNTVVTN